MSPPEAYLANASEWGVNGFAIAGTWGRREMVQSCERNCWRIGEAEALRAEFVRVVEVRERRRLREAPVRSMVTVVALGCDYGGQGRSIDLGSVKVESGVEDCWCWNGVAQLGLKLGEEFKNAKHSSLS